MTLSLSGMVKTPNGSPVMNASVRLVGLDVQFAHIPGVVHAPAPDVISWTRKIKGFSGHRWACWSEYLNDKIKGITWHEFLEDVLRHNPHLAADKNIFQAEKTYLIPEQITQVVWQRPVTGFTGNRWNAWEKFVKDQVSGISWPEFMEEVIRQNPSLAEGKPIFRANQFYRLPEEAKGAHIVWNKTLTGFSGTRWTCWEEHVKNQVEGLSWNEFVDAVLVYNSMLTVNKNLFKPEHTYLLPQTQYMEQAYLFTSTNSQGQYHFMGLSEPGPYQVEVKTADGLYHRSTVFVQNGVAYTIRLDAKRVEPQKKPVAQQRQQKQIKQQRPQRQIKQRPKQVQQRVEQEQQAQLRQKKEAQQKQSVGKRTRRADFVQTDGTKFSVHGKPLRFVGTNIRGLLHYGDTRLLRHSHHTHADIQLRASQEMGARVVRVFGANRHLGIEETGNRLQNALDKVVAHNMYMIFSFTDVHHDTGFNVPGDERFYQDNRLNKAWYEGGYRQNYLPFVEYLVKRFKNHPGIFAWELGNELKAWAPGVVLPDLFIQFARDVSNRIRQIDSGHLITTGIINSGNLGCSPNQARQLYQLPNLDFMTAHVYYSQNNSNQWLELEAQRAESDANLAQQLNMPFIIEEIGFEGGDRVQLTEKHLRKWFDKKRAAGFMQWGLMATNQDIGDGDNRFGIHGNQSDYKKVVNKIGNRAKGLYTAL